MHAEGIVAEAAERLKRAGLIPPVGSVYLVGDEDNESVIIEIRRTIEPELADQVARLMGDLRYELRAVSPTHGITYRGSDGRPPAGRRSRRRWLRRALFAMGALIAALVVVRLVRNYWESGPDYHRGSTSWQYGFAQMSDWLSGQGHTPEFNGLPIRSEDDVPAACKPAMRTRPQRLLKYAYKAAVAGCESAYYGFMD